MIATTQIGLGKTLKRISKSQHHKPWFDKKKKSIMFNKINDNETY
jgi:hypothetical protein